MDRRTVTRVVADRLPQGMRHRLRNLRAGRTPEGYVRGLLSIVVPAYNVERYIEECLQSLLDQTYRRIEIIVVDDGAIDGTRAVAARVRARDRRVRIISQPNGGLSAARNTGIRHATGEYLWFVDSDDTVEPHAAMTFLRSLQKTGSDFAVAQYRRFTGLRTWPAGPWIQDAHRVRRTRISATDFPEILVNAVAWSKVYRRSFWDRMGTTFPVGALYEDQPVSAVAYAVARSVDVLPDVLINWRDREDASSISQQTRSVADVTGRMHAAVRSVELLREHSSALAETRTCQLLSNDIQHSAKQLPHTSDDFWDALTAGVRALVADLQDSGWARILPHQAALVWLIAEGRRDDALRYLAADGLDAGRWPTEIDADVATLRVALSDEVDYPRAVVTMPPECFTPKIALRGATWIDDDTLQLDGWGFVTGLDSVEVPTTAEVELVGPGDVRIPLTTVRREDPRIDLVAHHKVNDYSAGAWRATVTRPHLVATGLERADFFLWVTLRNAIGTWRLQVRDVNLWGSTALVRPRFDAEGRRIAVILSDPNRLHLQLRRLPERAVSVDIRDEQIDVVVESTAPMTFVEARVTGNASSEPVAFPVESSGEGRWAFSIDPAALVGPRDTSWGLRLIDADGVAHEISWAAPETDWPTVAPTSLVSATQTVYGNLALARITRRMTVESIQVDGGTLRMGGRLLSGRGAPFVEMRDHRTQVRADVEWDGDRWTARIPLRAERWGRTPAPLPSGRYRLLAVDETTEQDFFLSEAFVATTPHESLIPGELTARVEVNPKQSRPEIILSAPLTREETGTRRQFALQRQQAAPGRPLRDAVLFRSFYGENTSCSNAGVHRELVERDYGLDLVWAVKDRSVPVPAGGRGVVVGTAEWFDLLATARYLFDNVHQPDFFHKHDGQVFVQTLHGYPFKTAGLRYWEQAGYSESRIASFLARHEQWDYLLSPAAYATPLLERDFRSTTATTLEIGYPRNDVFFDPNAQELRERTRAVLGIRPGQKAILYAPTYRDNLATSEFEAKPVDWLAPRDVVERLGDDHVVLMRGHAMNARTTSRAQAAPGVIDVTDYPEITELCLASDAAILDYSSLRFDYALTGNPMVFFVPDLDVYRDDARGWMLPYEETAPGPIARTVEECLAALADLDLLQRNTRPAVDAFRARFMEREDGHASARLVDAVFER